jgi:hypothetical protein
MKKMISFTDREIQRAWRNNLKASEVPSRNNAHRLLLFYAVECGLKAIIMKRQGKNRTDLCPNVTNSGHDINKLLDYLSAGDSLKLPRELLMKMIKTNSEKEDRTCTTAQINQMWRYGGTVDSYGDPDLEKQLISISEWIEQELR